MYSTSWHLNIVHIMQCVCNAHTQIAYTKVFPGKNGFKQFTGENILNGECCSFNVKGRSIPICLS